MSKFIENLQRKIERNSVKVNGLIWTDNSGKVHTEDILIKRSNFPLTGDWGRIYPVIDENGKPLWFNIIFGGKKNLIRLLVIMGIVTIVFLSFREFFNSYEILKTACEPFLDRLVPLS